MALGNARLQDMLVLQVYSTVDNAIVPSSLQYGSSDDVLNWLQSTLTLIWTDPVCGDGNCEEPFEYPSYGSFGCRADCGRLTDVYNVSTLQIDLYFDFTHPTGSVAATVSTWLALLLLLADLGMPCC